MKKWENFTEEEIQHFIDTSLDKNEFLSKMGYLRSYSRTLYEIQATYPSLNLSKFIEKEIIIRKPKNKNFQDLTGQKFNHLTVLKQGAYTKGSLVTWICRCDCGNITSPIRAAHLKDGHTKSCGCLQAKRASQVNLSDLTGEIYGELKVLERDTTKNDDTYWICQCSCGIKISVLARSLKDGATRSCGCIKSFGEKRIGEILNRNGISFIKEYNFKDLVSDKNQRLRFDFAIFDKESLKCLIEYQGKQHYYPCDFFGGEEGFKKLKQNDNKKIEYCKKNNIKLIIISFTDFERLNDNYILNLINNSI